MTQISGSISLDTGKISQEIIEVIMPALAEINANVARLTGLMSWMTLDDPATVEILAECFPRVGLPDEGRILAGTRAFVEVQARNLARAGYALVAVNGTALDRKARDNGVQPDLPAPVPPTDVPGDFFNRQGD